MPEIAHYGVKGMRWGVRNGEGSTKHEPSADHVRSREKKTIAKTSGVKALSNEELRVVIERMNLERQYSGLNPTATKLATKFVADLLLNTGKQQAARAANDFAGRKIAAAMAKAENKN